MIFEIENIPIYFPYNNIYPEQLKYIKSLLSSIKNPGHVLIEMPSGTGKTISLLSCTVSYLLYCKKDNRPFKIIYCSRTIAEIDKALKELKNLISYIKAYIQFDFFGIGLSRRENMCNNYDNKEENGKCLCGDLEDKNISLSMGVYTFDDLKELGKEEKFCPYKVARNSLKHADCIIYPYNYMVDPSIFGIVSEKLPKESVVIFDEAHNIDSHCIEALSIELTRNTLVSAANALKAIEEKVKTMKETVKQKMPNFFKSEQKVTALKLKTPPDDSIPYYFTPDFYLEEERNYEYAPGNLRQTNHFISVMKRLIEFFKTKLKSAHLTSESVNSFLSAIKDLTFIDKRTLKFCSHRFSILNYNLSLGHQDLPCLSKVAKFATMLAIYQKGCKIIFEPYDHMADVLNPILRFYCLDSSICMKHVFSNFRNVVITSGTLSPIDMYPRLLNFNPTQTVQIDATLERNSISPLIITKGDDQMLLNSEAVEKKFDIEQSNLLTTSFKHRIDGAVIRNYGNLLINLSRTVPDNIVAFFPSYIYMEEIVSIWSKTNIIKEIVKGKLVFIETPNLNETNIALRNFRKCGENGRGAILFCVARGKVSEGVDFEGCYGRAAVMLGVPFMHTESVRINERLKYLFDEYGIEEYDFLLFDAMRHAAQCLGRVIRNKNDYGLMILADHRFNAKDKKENLPKWIKERIEDGNIGLSIDMAVSIAKHFFRTMAQPLESNETTLINEKDLIKIFANKK